MDNTYIRLMGHFIYFQSVLTKTNIHAIYMCVKLSNSLQFVLFCFIFDLIWPKQFSRFFMKDVSFLSINDMKYISQSSKKIYSPFEGENEFLKLRMRYF